MKEFLVLGGAVLPIFVIVAAGLLLRRLNWLTEDADHSLLRVCINLFIPALIFASILGNEALRDLNNLIIPPIVGFGAATIGIGIGWVVSRWSGAANRDQRASFALTAGLQNYVYYALPIVALLFNHATVGVLFLHNVGVDAVLWTVGVATLSGANWGASWRGLLNAPIISLLCAVTLNLAQPHARWLAAMVSPGGVLMTVAHTLGGCAIPVGLLLTGAIVADHIADLRRGPSVRIVSMALLVRFLAAPILYLTLATLLPFSLELKRVLVVQGTMPSAMFPVLMTRRYGGDSCVAVQIVVATTIASLVMAPIWMRIAALFIPM